MIEYCVVALCAGLLLAASIEIKFLVIALCIGLVLLATILVASVMMLSARIDSEQKRFNDD